MILHAAEAGKRLRLAYIYIHQHRQQSAEALKFAEIDWELYFFNFGARFGIFGVPERPGAAPAQEVLFSNGLNRF